MSEPWPPPAQQPKPPEPAPPRPTRDHERRPGLSWVLVLLILAGIIVLSLGPEFIPDLPDAWNPLQHAVGYAALMWLLLSALSARSAALTETMIALAALLVIALSVALEVAQAAVNRDVEMTDVLANIAGVVGAVFAWVLMRSVRQDRGP